VVGRTDSLLETSPFVAVVASRDSYLDFSTFRAVGARRASQRSGSSNGTEETGRAHLAIGFFSGSCRVIVRASRTGNLLDSCVRTVVTGPAGEVFITSQAFFIAEVPRWAVITLPLHVQPFFVAIRTSWAVFDGISTDWAILSLRANVGAANTGASVSWQTSNAVRRLSSSFYSTRGVRGAGNRILRSVFAVIARWARRSNRIGF